MDKVYSAEEIKQLLQPVFKTNPVYSAVLFGSYAKGTATPQSDVDIVIDSRGQLLNIDFYGVLEEISERLNKTVDLFELAEIHKPSQIYNRIQYEGVTIYDGA